MDKMDDMKMEKEKEVDGIKDVQSTEKTTTAGEAEGVMVEKIVEKEEEGAEALKQMKRQAELKEVMEASIERRGSEGTQCSHQQRRSRHMQGPTSLSGRGALTA